MRGACVAAGLLAVIGSAALGADAPPIVIIDSATPTQEVARKPGGIYVGETIIHKNADETVQIGVWEADVSKTKLIDYPFTEYVLMISGRVIVINDDGSYNEFAAGDTFVMPKGFTGIWDIRERMKKQHIKIGDPNAKPTAQPIKD
ncbi:MAG: cupin domain-containing protein [Geminicoccaceae bacterium]